ncbi:hypothetical protein J6590_032362 [Homalodisca vitripennis]|nr:hypothetical protein J6590_032362 [Homalodisca vitripennis]
MTSGARGCYVQGCYFRRTTGSVEDAERSGRPHEGWFHLVGYVINKIHDYDRQLTLTLDMNSPYTKQKFEESGLL